MKKYQPALAAPLLIGLYGAIRLLPGSKEPEAGWLLGHAALLAGLLLFVPVLLELRRRVASRLLGTVALVVAGTGLAASVGQTLIDLWVGAVAVDKADQHRLFGEIQDVPGVLPVFYTALPTLFYLGLLVLLVAAARQIPLWSPLLVLVATVLMAMDLDLMTPGAVLFALALRPLTVPAAAPARSVVRSRIVSTR
ncbi:MULTISPECIES: hypothetical protein [unclassified Kitasatospora]|uniref:hypothetical protein n=1 Tax=unclassified Kitasatospora TaxID=2633591 RepID=UPI00070ED15A|nr:MULTISPECIES: hypothetical protein [unclassified Kitasatospora]KQV18516.1 hypothetical protein ASC99_04605 [Kitasatospora sp. Root107]KRB74499.1 hypothetical protein ASE03_18525 [Kitasatospora sp. Root187]